MDGSKKKFKIAAVCIAAAVCAGVALCAAATGHNAGEAAREKALARAQAYTDAIAEGRYGEAWDMVFDGEADAFLGRDAFIASYENAGAQITGGEVTLTASPGREGSETMAQAEGEGAAEEDATQKSDSYIFTVTFTAEGEERLANDYAVLEITEDAANGQGMPRLSAATAANIMIAAPEGANVMVDGIAVSPAGADGAAYIIPEIFKGAHRLTVETDGFLPHDWIYNIMSNDQEISPAYHLDGAALIELQEDTETVLSGVFGQINGEDIGEECLALFTDTAIADHFSLALYEDSDYFEYTVTSIDDLSVMPSDHAPDVGKYALEADFMLRYTERLLTAAGAIAEQKETPLSYEFIFTMIGGQWLIEDVFPMG